MVALAILPACDEPFRPQSVAGTYVLRTVRGDRVPAVVWKGDVAEMRVLADTLRLNADGTGQEGWQFELATAHGTTIGRTDSPLRFEVHDATLDGVYLCPPSAGCFGMIEPLHGEFTRYGLRLDIGKHGDGPLLYERTDP